VSLIHQNEFLKTYLKFFHDKKEQILLSVVIIFVALSSFALGRYSTGNQSDAQADTSITQKGNYASKNTQTNTSPQTSGSFVASKSGTKYYLSTCSGVSKISDKNKVYFKTESEAQLAGYSRASNCSF
jgi:hypothetical protein